MLRCDVVSITGSPLWGLGVEKTLESHVDLGWEYLGEFPGVTDYGPAPKLYGFKSDEGRTIGWIPTYGSIYGEDVDPITRERKLFTVLERTGAKLVVVGGTSGTNDWRDVDDPDFVRPGDLVFPWSYYPERPMAGALPHLGLWGFLPQGVVPKQPFCPEAQGQMAEIAESYFERIHTPKTVRAILRSPAPPAFESEFETLVWRFLTRELSQGGSHPYVMLHGDCVSPVLARQIGVHWAYYHFPVNLANGHPGEQGEVKELLTTIEDFYVRVFPERVLRFEHEVLESVSLPPEDNCLDYRDIRPPSFVKSLGH